MCVCVIFTLCTCLDVYFKGFWGTRKPCDFRCRRISGFATAANPPPRTRKMAKKSHNTPLGRGNTNLWALLDLSGRRIERVWISLGSVVSVDQVVRSVVVSVPVQWSIFPLWNALLASSVGKKRPSRPSARTIVSGSFHGTLHLKGPHMLPVIVCQIPFIHKSFAIFSRFSLCSGNDHPDGGGAVKALT